MQFKNKTKLVFVLVVIAICIQACASNQIRVGWVGGSTGDRIHYVYKQFNGQESASIKADPGQSLSLLYDVQIDQGSVTIELFDPEQELVWERVLMAGESGKADLRADLQGRYILLVSGHNTKGGFDLSWERN